MKAYTIVIAALTMATVAACSHKGDDGAVQEMSVGTTTSIEGDSTLYGLACEGCTDSVVVMLPGDGSDPVTYDIVDAMKEGRVAGRLETGSWICLMLDPADSTKARSVINLDQLKGTWVQMVCPTLKTRLVEVEEDEETKAKRDSVMNEILQPVEVGFAIKRHYTAAPVGMHRDTENSPVVYPSPRMYTEWHIFNGRIVLIGGQQTAVADTLTMSIDTVAVETPVVVSDTAEVLLLTRDSLRLRFQDGTTNGYYRK